MSLRSLITAAWTIAVAIVLAVVIPVAQLRTVSTETECCCPDPDTCKCPDHKPDTSTQATIKACHKTSTDFVAPALPAFVSPAIVLARVPAIEAPRAVHDHGEPHPPPAPRRPDAPS